MAQAVTISAGRAQEFRSQVTVTSRSQIVARPTRACFYTSPGAAQTDGAPRERQLACARHRIMRVFLDFEASSLSPNSYPIEVGWVFEDGGAEQHLIRPADGWRDWDPAAEAVHHIAREQLQEKGEPHAAVAHRMLDRLAPHALFATAPSWDGKWLSVLLRSAGLPRHALRLGDADEAHLAAARDILEARGVDLAQAPDLLAQARAAIARAPPQHRALADAELELAVFRDVRRRAMTA
jgi:hypothetical protein